MKVAYSFSYCEDIIPPRCRKPRKTRFDDGLFTGEIQCLDDLSAEEKEALFPLAFVVYEKLYETGPDREKHTEYRGYVPSRQLYVRNQNLTVEMLVGKDWSRNRPLKEIQAEIQEWCDSLLIFQNEVWQRTRYEPCYQISTYLPNEVSLTVSTVEQAPVHSDNIYRADELELAKERAIKMALLGNNPEAARRLRTCEQDAWRIDVYRIDFSRMLTLENREGELLNELVVDTLRKKLDYGKEDIPDRLRIELMRSCQQMPGFRELSSFEKGIKIVEEIRKRLNRQGGII